MIKRIPKNHVLVEVTCLRHKKIPFKSGMDIIVDPDFAKEQHAQTRGIVKAIPEALYFNTQDNESTEYKTPITAKVGDEVFFHYLQVNRAVNENKTIYKDGKYYIFISHDSIFCTINDNGFKMHNGWILLEPIQLAVDKAKKYIDTLPKDRQDHDPLVAKIKYIGEPVEEYFYGYEEKDQGVDVKEGDTVIFSPNSDIPLEYPMHQSLDKKYFRAQRKELLSIILN